MENRCDDTDVAKPQLDAIKHTARLDDLAAIGLLPVNLVVAGASQFLIDSRNEEVGELLHPH